MSSPQSRAATIQRLVMDVDGVLANRQIYCGETREELKVFDIKDGPGLQLVNKAGVKPAIITDRFD
ncbi:hypothetical protein [Candidatus Marimicrobium litorale]|uniref:Phenylphosphate carboxylase subunit delta n=1 Tax=Candidatus Marimicrobium litorale TaxID=2518991 RepID=A0ABT3T4W2_9GAMM|nr:hypothetical protein [Candidatus Marimicrobium litorale]MCX2977322.1 hypothetical protein [Candidatus Marimicrobium litorale]